MPLDLTRDTIFVTLAGSQAQGTAREGSDVDLRGVCVAPLDVRVALFSSFEQHEGPLDGALWDEVLARLQAHPTARHGLAIKTECVIFDVGKFLSLCASANPNALEVMFADPRDWVHETPVWRAIHRERQRFLSKKVQQTYLGYALAQLKKIKAHRAWLLAPPKEKPTRKALGLPEQATLSRDDQNRLEQAIAERVRSYGIETLEMPKALRIAVVDRLRAFHCDSLARSEETLDEGLREVAIAALALPGQVVDTLAAERKYRGAMRHWEAYQGWKAERNPARAVLEEKHGYDTKHAMHLLRLMKTGVELLETGELRVRRDDAAELHAVRDGALSYDELIARAHGLEERMQRAAHTSALPDSIDFGFVEALAREAIGQGRGL